MTPAYSELQRRWTQLHHFEHLQAMASWDQAAIMPPKGAPARASAMAEMEGLLHRLRTDPQLPDLLQRAEDEALNDHHRANLREMKREWHNANALPQSLVEAVSLAGARCEHAWRTQRPANDWTGFLVNFREVLRLGREVAQRLSESTGLAPYDALLDQYEPGTTHVELDRIFGDLQQWLPDLVRKVRHHQAREAQSTPLILPTGPFAKAIQREMSLEIMTLLEFDFEAGRLDESAHPFSGGVPQDTRLTTRYREDDFMQSLMGTIHETGHARYEQNLPRDWLNQPVGKARSMTVHESQSLSFEMQLGRSPAFAELLAPRLRARFGHQAAFEPSNLHRLMTRVEPSFIRVDADEVTYPAHVLLRYQLERDLIGGDLQADDLPAAWNEGMQSLLGISTLGNDKDGCMQDVHWPTGTFGYFPSYTLGAVYAAQWFATIRRTWPDLHTRITRGELSCVFDWLNQYVWSQASRWSTADLLFRATGERLNLSYYKKHLEDRYLRCAASA
jgi:carboxypeptidase Taq